MDKKEKFKDAWFEHVNEFRRLRWSMDTESERKSQQNQRLNQIMKELEDIIVDISRQL